MSDRIYQLELRLISYDATGDNQEVHDLANTGQTTSKDEAEDWMIDLRGEVDQYFSMQHEPQEE